MTEAAAEASELESVSVARIGDALAGGASRTGHLRLSRRFFTQWRAAESEGGIAHRAWGQCRRVVVLGGAVGVREGAWPTGA